MGQTVSIKDLASEASLSNPKQEEPIQPPSSTTVSGCNPVSRSNSMQSLSQISNTSNLSTISTMDISMSDKFISYDNTVINIPAISPLTSNNYKLYEYNLSIIAKFNDEIMLNNYSHNESICLVFGVCDRNLLSKGYQHRYYGYGYSVTYCHGYKFQSYATTFKKDKNIIIKYDPYKGEIIFGNKQRKIRIDKNISNVVTIKCYNDAYDVQVDNL